MEEEMRKRNEEYDQKLVKIAELQKAVKKLLKIAEEWKAKFNKVQRDSDDLKAVHEQQTKAHKEIEIALQPAEMQRVIDAKDLEWTRLKREVR